MTIRLDWNTDSKGIAFIHIPKTGGTSIEELLFKEFNPHITKLRHCPVWRTDLIPETYYKFAVFRNPYERAWSFYNELYNVIQDNRYQELKGEYEKGFEWLLENRFDMLLDEEQFPEPFKARHSQLWWITHNGKLAIDKLLWLDTLDSDFAHIANKLSTTKNLTVPKVNIGVKRCNSQYTVRAKELVDTYYADDIEFWKEQRQEDPWQDSFYKS